MPVCKTCEQCGNKYFVPPAREKKSRFCSVACANVFQTTSARRLVTCETCQQQFTARQDHGKWPRFCSRKCFLAVCVQPQNKECENCGAIFTADRCNSSETPDQLRRYCCTKCSFEAKKKGKNKKCVNCGDTFYISSSTENRLNGESCCSKKCAAEFYSREKNKNWKGGFYIDATSGEKRVNAPRPGYVSEYVGEHRIVASKIVGRLLEPHEKILHINNKKTDNRPENLFICGSVSECNRRISGTLEWPKTSNLSDYK